MSDTLNAVAAAGTFKNVLGTPIAQGTISFLTTDSANRPIPCRIGSGGGQVLAENAPFTLINGGFTGTVAVPNPAVSLPQNVRLRITVHDDATGTDTVYRNVLARDSDGTGTWNLASANLTPDQDTVLVDVRQGARGLPGVNGLNGTPSATLYAIFNGPGTATLTHSLGTLFPACTVFYVSGARGSIQVSPVNFNQVLVTASAAVVALVECFGYAATVPGAGIIRSWAMNEGFGDASLDTVVFDVLSLRGSSSWANDVSLGVMADFGAAGALGGCAADSQQTNFDRTDSFSFACWIKAATQPAAASYILHSIDGNVVGYGLYLTGGRLVFQLLSNLSTSNFMEFYGPVNGIAPNTLYHVGCVWNGAAQQASLYVNGVRQTITDSSGTTHLTGPIKGAAQHVCIGANSAGAQVFPGMIGRAVLYNTALTDADFLSLYTLPSTGIIRHWAMNEGQGSSSSETVAADVLHYRGGGLWGADVTLGAMASFGSGAATGGYAGDSQQTNFDRTDSFSFACWIKPSALPSAASYLLNSIDANTVGYGFYLLGGRLVLQLLSNLSVSNYMEFYGPAGLIAAGTLYHVGFSWNGASQKASLFVNGVSASITDSSATTHLTGTIKGAAPHVCIGGNNTGDQVFPGLVGRASLYNKTLTAVDFANLYNTRS